MVINYSLVVGFSEEDSCPGVIGCLVVADLPDVKIFNPIKFLFAKSNPMHDFLGNIILGKKYLLPDYPG